MKSRLIPPLRAASPVHAYGVKLHETAKMRIILHVFAAHAFSREPFHPGTDRTNNASFATHTVWVIKKFPFRLRGTVFQRYYALRFCTVSVFIISVLLILTRSMCECTGRCETDNGRCGTDNGRCGTDDGIFARQQRSQTPRTH